MFGGGYETRCVDPLMPIRPAAIRGHLRFWWRATAGAQYTTPGALFDAEEAIWGSMEKPGKVRIGVEDVKYDDPVIWARFERNPRYPSKYKALATQLIPQWPRYALHPFQGRLKKPGFDIEIEPDRALESCAMVVKLHYAPAHGLAIELENTINAWICLGGVGARTRRGCGSLMAETGGLPDGGQRISASQGTPVTLLSGTRYVLGAPMDSAVSAWKTAVETYAAFRQMRYPGHPPMPGRSKWPEPDSIRRIENRPSYAHPPGHSVQCGFPRADLGLPIVFHFKDQGDPDEHTLQAASQGATRLASPVITKAIAMPNGKYRPLVAVLQAPHAWELGDLDLNGTPVIRAWIELSPTDRAACDPLNGQDVRSAVLEYARQRWNSKVQVLP
ncbi:MAG: type III-B CRISPR module RAMP protein Cmr1 [Chthonomonadales bacterium]|nr:type III-B CRISPR module RAMP protein Cmr1 [Chthonomonadales bacterium]